MNDLVFFVVSQNPTKPTNTRLKKNPKTKEAQFYSSTLTLILWVITKFYDFNVILQNDVISTIL